MPEWMINLLTKAPTTRDTGVSIQEGERNTTLTELAAKLKQSGKSRQQIETTLLEENLLHCKPPLPDEEVHSIAEWAASINSNGSFKTQWQNAVMRDPELRMYQRGILVSLSLYMDADGKDCWPTTETLEAEFHVSRKALSSALDAGIKRGWLDRYKRPKPKNSTGKQKWSYGYIAKMRED
ncbi:primase C-terminal domain-containing protein [Solemya elarraichensis gill symbiont]|uniref:Primase C-terminal 1 domain-containing protein n=1 Tax=Solemya elarraichensis gill symbiont TaxID=1918949 RepID=A0A1T2L570_9GAMM|nr:helix-turn-helix domain-containing protein [Solemya elarraichensis gill symbiont]OOZ40233.1 hypothetical protein BOW52_06125 [Solemya elarraichensis gill symbiont]